MEVRTPCFLKTKSDVQATFATFLTDIGAQGTPSTVGCVRLDNGTKDDKKEFVALPDRHGTRREYTPVDSAKHNGVAERCITRTP